MPLASPQPQPQLYVSVSFRRQRRGTETVGWREHPIILAGSLQHTEGDKIITAVKHMATYLLLL